MVIESPAPTIYFGMKLHNPDDCEGCEDKCGFDNKTCPNVPMFTLAALFPDDLEKLVHDEGVDVKVYHACFQHLTPLLTMMGRAAAKTMTDLSLNDPGED